MNRLPSRLAAAALPLLLALMLTACGNDGSGDPESSDSATAAPTSPATPSDSPSEAGAPDTGSGGAVDAPIDAMAEDFCGALNSGPQELGDDNEQAVEEIHAYGDSLAAVGTPAEVSGDARAGFEVLVDFFANIEAGDVEAFGSQGTPEEVLGAENGALASAFFTRAIEVCQETLSTDGATPSAEAS